MSEISKLSENDSELITNYLLRKGIRSFSTNSFYSNIQRAAVNLGIIEDSNSVRSGVALILSNEDYFKVADKIWNFILNGFLAPGYNYNNPWFPQVHLTEKGKEYLKTIDKKNKES